MLNMSFSSLFLVSPLIHSLNVDFAYAYAAYKIGFYLSGQTFAPTFNGTEINLLNEYNTWARNTKATFGKLSTEYSTRLNSSLGVFIQNPVLKKFRRPIGAIFVPIRWQLFISMFNQCFALFELKSYFS
ncbi:hypothetical protein L596_010299 [Steinernema carpocapsae]|uniref:Uncharacterized protein n=1 Tax=Steinernema carpocapsae TaxID=34508 RepID=A0A4U5PI69_STECR|nr:hypothetical protein L596_010299 [Steinernema carpocapsae]